LLNRNLLEILIESFGYTVVLKENGKDAIDFFVTENKANRKLGGMIFDLTIPGGMGGKNARTLPFLSKVDIRETRSWRILKIRGRCKPSQTFYYC